MIRKMGEHPEQYVRQPGRDFTRPRTLTFETVISLLLTMSENSIGKILIGRFQNSEKTPSASAFVQQRQKLLPVALETLFHRLTAFWSARPVNPPPTRRTQPPAAPAHPGSTAGTSGT